MKIKFQKKKLVWRFDASYNGLIYIGEHNSNKFLHLESNGYCARYEDLSAIMDDSMKMPFYPLCSVPFKIPDEDLKWLYED